MTEPLAPKGSPGLMGYLRSQVTLPSVTPPPIPLPSPQLTHVVYEIANGHVVGGASLRTRHEFVQNNNAAAGYNRYAVRTAWRYFLHPFNGYYWIIVSPTGNPVCLQGHPMEFESDTLAHAWIDRFSPGNPRRLEVIRVP